VFYEFKEVKMKKLEKIMFVMKEVDYYPPLGIMQLSANAKQEGCTTSLGIIEKGNVLQKIRENKPDLVAYGGGTGEHVFYTNFNRSLKKLFPNQLTVIGGPHATYFPEVLEEGKFDYLIRGEAENTFKDFIYERPVDRVIQPGPLVENLDDLPFPDRELFFNNEECNETGKSGSKHFMVGRGCPYQCTYCFNSSAKKMYKGQKRIRKHSVDYVIEEVKQIKEKYGLESIKFYDDVFTTKNTKWLKEFADKFPKEVGVPFFTMMRYDMLNEENVGLLKDAGCRALQCSIESTNDRIRNDILKRNMSNETMEDGIKLCQDNGITVVPNIMLGLPTSTLEDDLAGIDFIIKNKVGYCDFPIYQPYPKTELGDYCIKNNYFNGDFSDMHMSFGHHSVMNFSEDRKRILKNLATLGTVACYYPELKDMIVEQALNAEYSEAFFKAYFHVKTDFFAKNVYDYQHSDDEQKALVKKTNKLEPTKR